MNRTSGGQNLPSRVVYIGSIPYDQTEEQILDLCRNVGPVSNLKMMFDPQTGKSKGYAFVEYKDLESSASAVRNLNGYQFGSRLLKCGYATGTDIENNENNNNNNNNMEDSTSLKFARLPAGVDVNINMTTPAMMISSELAKRNGDAQLGLLRNLQEWTRKNPEDAVDLLRECPQLSFVIAEILLTNGISNVDDLTQLAVQRNETPEAGGPGADIPQDPTIQNRQRELLRQVLQLSDGEIAVLPDDEKMSLWDLKQRATRGEFGLI